ncbi:hypothetical protein PRIPAC_97955 [Pristionchus pacificus]|uniref:Gamma-glutamylcyclotransferase family protein n=1 Tax=Pristionchus pacificus TaxID=54126 RepID=A0A2A6D2E1_PRIPA|nr:hypothetical protein PRIPAC_97955 [Pristionchus pacificus]|eukprot:PDM84642.1 hypothetical protein PRIPAC_33665 [Pristionchus pacificus]
MPLQTVFIYGTVISGQSNHDILNAFEGYHRLIGLARTVDSFPLVPVEGELYEMDESKLTLLDALNRHPHFYERLQEKMGALIHVVEFASITCLQRR